jgi:thioesterase domain-containing protein
MMDSYPFLGNQSLDDVAPNEITELMRREGRGDIAIDLQFIEALVNASTRLLRLVQAAPVGYFAGPAIFFTAKLDRADPSLTAESWVPYISGPIKNHDLMTSHFDMVQRVPLMKVARILSKSLQEGAR